jgi:hypothetical protein
MCYMYHLSCLLFYLLATSGENTPPSTEAFICNPPPSGPVPSFTSLPGPPPAQVALRPYVGRRCQYLTTPDEKYTLEMCLYRSLRFIDQENFSIFLGYYEKWAADGSSVQEYGGGQAWGCPNDIKRSVTLKFVCPKDAFGGLSSIPSSPFIALWKEVEPCKYIVHIALDGYCSKK